MSKITQEELDAKVLAAIMAGHLEPFLHVHVPLAIHAVDNLICREAKNHGPMDWKDQGEEGNLEHAETHLEKLCIPSGEIEDHLLNATCRLLMALQLREESKS